MRKTRGAGDLLAGASDTPKEIRSYEYGYGSRKSLSPLFLCFVQRAAAHWPFHRPVVLRLGALGSTFPGTPGRESPACPIKVGPFVLTKD